MRLVVLLALVMRGLMMAFGGLCVLTMGFHFSLYFAEGFADITEGCGWWSVCMGGGKLISVQGD